MLRLASANPFDSNPTLRDKYANERRILGSGYNTYTKGLLSSACVQGSFGAPEQSASASTYEMRLLNSVDELSRELAAEASVDANIGAFSAKMSSSYSQSEKSSTNRTYLLIKVRVETQGLVIQDDKAALAAEKTGQDFYRPCGNAYVSRVVMGGEFIALLVAQNSSDELAQTFSGSASASYGSSSGSASFSSKMNELKTSQSLEVNMTRIGGNSDIPAFTTGPAGVDALTAYAATFPKSVESGQALAVRVETSSYDNLGLNVTDDFAAPHFQAATNALGRTGEELHQLSLVREAYDKFYLPDGQTHPTLREKADSLKTTLSLRALILSAWLDKCGPHFWDKTACAWGPLVGLQTLPAPAAPLLVMASVDPQHRNPTRYAAPVPMMVVLRGRYCWDGGQECAQGMDGVTSSGDAYVAVTPPWQRYGGGPVGIGAGVTTEVLAVDTDYGDNFAWSGDGLKGLWAVFYQP